MIIIIITNYNNNNNLKIFHSFHTSWAIYYSAERLIGIQTFDSSLILR